MGTDRDVDARFIRSLYDEHGHALLAYVARLTHDQHRAEDIVQETLLRAWKHAGRLTGDDRPLRPWLFTVARRLVIDEHRRSPLAEIDLSAVAELSAPDEIDRALEAWQVADAIRTLSAEHRAALIETYYRGHTITQAAPILGVPVGTVKSRVFYALRAVRLVLEERGWSG